MNLNKVRQLIEAAWENKDLLNKEIYKSTIQQNP